MVKRFYPVECTKPLRCLNQRIAGSHSVLRKSLCSFLDVHDACQDPSGNKKLRSREKKHGLQNHAV